MRDPSDKQTPSPAGGALRQPDSGTLVDVTLIEETLRMTPEERLLLNDRMIRTVLELRNGFRQT